MPQHIFESSSELQNIPEAAPKASPSFSVSEKLALYGSSALSGVDHLRLLVVAAREHKRLEPITSPVSGSHYLRITGRQENSWKGSGSVNIVTGTSVLRISKAARGLPSSAARGKANCSASASILSTRCWVGDFLNVR